MKKAIITSALIIHSLMLWAHTPVWSFEKSHCKISFSVAHFGISETEGQFKKFDGSITTTKNDFSDAQIDFSVDVNSINTDDEKRDNHLKSPDFFDAAKFPTLHFKSKSMKSVGKNKYKLYGDFTMHGVTKPVSLVLKGGGSAEYPKGVQRTGFTGSTVLKRSEFGMNTMVGPVGDDVQLSVSFEGIKK
jgi:polyisoprenoid-binding protein YceI